jgi:hypothetical protein
MLGRCGCTFTAKVLVLAAVLLGRAINNYHNGTIVLQGLLCLVNDCAVTTPQVATNRLKPWKLRCQQMWQ